MKPHNIVANCVVPTSFNQPNKNNKVQLESNKPHGVWTMPQNCTPIFLKNKKGA